MGNYIINYFNIIYVFSYFQSEETHDWYCFECHKPGEVLCCGSCYKVYHPACAGKEEDYTGAWICPMCEVIFELFFSVAWVLRQLHFVGPENILVLTVKWRKCPWFGHVAWSNTIDVQDYSAGHYQWLKTMRPSKKPVHRQPKDMERHIS